MPQSRSLTLPRIVTLRRLLAAVLFLTLASPPGLARQTQVMRAPGYYLPPPTPSPTVPATHGSSHGSNLLDLNTATLDQLRSLPGMGMEYARRIVAGRPYHAKNQLVRRGILPAAEYARIHDLVVAHRATADGASRVALVSER